MTDFIYSLFTDPLHITEYIAAIIASFYFQKASDTKLLLFFLFLSYVCFTETVGFYLKFTHKSNLWVYDIYTYIEQMYFYYIFYHYINNLKVKQIIIGFVVFLNISYFLNVFILDIKYPIYPSNAFLINQIFLIITIFYFLIEFFLSDKGLKATNYLIFWVSIAVLFYYITFLPLDTVLRGFAKDSTKIIAKMRTIIIIILYSTYSFGFIWSKEKY
jgi:hypothetical protein